MPIPVVLLAFANDRQAGGDYLSNLPAELNSLRELLRPGELAGRWEVVPLANTTLDTLLAVFQDPGYRDRIAVLHYGGHAGAFGLLLEDAAGRPTVAGARGLASFLGHQQGLACVFLNGCSTVGQVRGLTDAGVRAVIATSHAIDDVVARKFAANVYKGLAGGGTLQRAFGEAHGAAAAALHAPVRARRRVDSETPPAPGESSPIAMRDALSPDFDDEIVDERGWPWVLTARPGDSGAEYWSLGIAAGDPLWGLPPLPAADLPPEPYRHLLPYGPEHAAVFFGRGRLIRTLYEVTTSPAAPPIVVVSGQSGAGKSSLLAAGLLPRLANAYETRYARLDARRGLVGTVREALAAGTSDTVTASLADAWRAAEVTSGRPMLVVLDQVDEAFTAAGDTGTETDEFFDGLSALFRDRAARPAGRLVVGLRKEWYLDLEARLKQRGLLFEAQFVDRLDEAGVLEAITGPARDVALRGYYRLTIDPGLPEEIATILRGDIQSPIAPTLQVLLASLWSRADARAGARTTVGRVFDRAVFKTLQREGLLLDDYLGKQLARMEALPGVGASGLALDFLAFHTTPLGTAATRTPAEVQHEYRHVPAAVAALVVVARDTYLLVDPAVDDFALGSSGADAIGATRLAHDTLAPLIRHRFESSVLPGQRARRVIEGRAGEWSGGAVGRPLDSTDLELVETGSMGMRSLCSDAEERLVAASRMSREAERWAAAARRRTRRATSTAISAAGVLLGILGLVAWRQGRRATYEAARAQRASVVQVAVSAAERGDWIRAITLIGTLDSLAVPEAAVSLARRALYESSIISVLAPDERKTSATGSMASSVASAAFSPDGRRIVAASRDGTTRVWDAATGRALATLAGHQGTVWSAAFSPDGQRVVTTSQDSTARVWDAATGQTLATLAGHQGVVWSAAFSPDGRRIVTTSRDGTTRVWDAATGQTLATFTEHRRIVWSATFSPDGRRILTASDDSTARVWDDATGQTLATLAGHRGVVIIAAFSPDGRRIVTASDDSTARVWDAATGQTLATLAGHRGTVYSAAFSPDGRRIVTASDDSTARVWDAATGQTLATLAGHQGVVIIAEFSPDGQRIVAASRDGTTRVWDAATGQALDSVAGHEGEIGNPVFSPDRRRVVFRSRDGTRGVYNVQHSHAMLVGYGDKILDATFSPDGRRILTASGNSTARVWDAATGRALATLAGHRGTVWRAAFSPDGRRIVTGADDSTARVWDAATGQTLATLAGHQGVVWSAAFSPDGRRIVTTSRDATTRVWDAVTGQTLATFTGHQGAARSAAFSPDGRRIVTASADSTARVWDDATGQILATLAGHRGTVYSAAFSPDGRRIVTASADSTARVWDAATGQILATLAGHAQRDVVHAAFSPDGRRVITASFDGPPHVWDAATGQAVDSLPVPGLEWVEKAEFSPDGRRLLTLSFGGIARVWWLGWNDLLNEIALRGACVSIADRVRLFGLDSTTALRQYDHCKAGGRETLRL